MIPYIHDTHKKVEGASEFEHLLLDAMGGQQGLSRVRIADIYESYVKSAMRTIDACIESEAA